MFFFSFSHVYVYIVNMLVYFMFHVFAEGHMVD